MRKIKLCDTDLELFDIEIAPAEFTFYTKHKETFKKMWREQGKPFWTRFAITFRSFTVKHGVIKQMSIDTPKFQNLIDQAFIFIHEQFVDGKENMAKNFVEDIAKLAQNQDKFAECYSKSCCKDPFYVRDTRELFRHFFGPPDQKSSYLKVYTLTPVFLRFGGSVCRCLVRWIEAESMDRNDDSYWIPPSPHIPDKSTCVYDTVENVMCSKCIDECGERFFKEKICGNAGGPRFVTYWTLGDPRFHDKDNPLYAAHCDPLDDWRNGLSAEQFRVFLSYCRTKYGADSDQCAECADMKKNRDKMINACRKKKKKKKGDDTSKAVERAFENVEHLFINNDKSVKSVTNSESVPEDKKNNSKKKKRSKKSPEVELDNEPKKVTPEVHLSITDGFKVYRSRTEDGVLEVTISSCTSRTETQEAMHIAALKAEFLKDKKNSYLMHTKLVKEKIKALPKRFEWWEGRGFCIAVLDYEKDERSHVNHCWTNFSLKVSGYNELAIKRTMLKLLLYVVKRKKRIPSNDWTMDADDVLTCILPEESSAVQDQTINILRGQRFDDCLTPEEADSLKLHQPYLDLNKVLMGLQEREASNMLVEKGGKEKLKRIFKRIASKPIYGNNHQCHKANKLRNDNPQRNGASIIWDQMIEDPDAFDFTVLIEKTNEEDMLKLGLRKINIRHYLNNVNPFLTLCPNCKTVGKICDCYPPKETPQSVIDFIDKTCFPLDDTDKKIANGQETELLDKTTKAVVDKIEKESPNDIVNNIDNDNPCEVGPDTATGEKCEKNTKKEIEIHADETLDRKVDNPCEVGPDTDTGVKCEKTTKEEIEIHADETLDRKVEDINDEDQNKDHEKNLDVKEEDGTDNDEEEDGWSSSAESEEAGSDEKIKNRTCEIEPEIKEQMTRDLDKMTEDMMEMIKQMNARGDKKCHIVAVEDNAKTEFTEASEFMAREAKLRKQEKKRRKKEAKQQKTETREEPYNMSSKETNPEQEKERNGPKVNAEFDKAYAGIPEQLAAMEQMNKIEVLDPEIVEKLMRRQKEANPEIPISNATIIQMTMTVTSKGPKMIILSDPLNPGGNKADDLTRQLQEKFLQVVQLRNCSNCGKKEPTRKAFKKCQKCRDESVRYVRYYCGRDCQVEDWKNKHKQEHLDNKLG